MNALKSLPTQVISFTKKNYLWIILAVLFLTVVFTLSTGEGFEDFDSSWKTLAEYPAVFIEKVKTPFLKENTYTNYYLPSEKSAEPMTVESQQLELKDYVAKVPIDIGNGLAVEANVKIGPQTVNIKSQESVKIGSPQVTDTKIEAQSIAIPAQEGIIPARMTEDGGMVAIPVKIEAQTVTIEKQNAIIPTIEPFRSF